MNEERGYVIYDPVGGFYTTSKGFIVTPFDKELIRAYIFRTYKSAENCEWYEKNRHQILPVSLSIICKPLEKEGQL